MKKLFLLSNQKQEKIFFARGKKIAGLLDKGKPIRATKVISFEDTNDLIKFLTAAKMEKVVSSEQLMKIRLSYM